MGKGGEWEGKEKMERMVVDRRKEEEKRKGFSLGWKRRERKGEKKRRDDNG